MMNTACITVRRGVRHVVFAGALMLWCQAPSFAQTSVSQMKYSKGPDRQIISEPGALRNPRPRKGRPALGAIAIPRDAAASARGRLDPQARELTDHRPANLPTEPRNYAQPSPVVRARANAITVIKPSREPVSVDSNLEPRPRREKIRASQVPGADRAMRGMERARTANAMADSRTSTHRP